MTLEASNDAASPRTLAALVMRQVEAIDAWIAAREKRTDVRSASAATRESRMDLARRLDVLRRVDAAMRDRTGQFLAREPDVLMYPLPTRAVVAHRHEWFVDKMTEGLRERGVQVVGVTENGADALGLVIAEQPELLFVEQKLAMLTGQELAAEAALFAPATLIAAQVERSDDIASMIDAGARAAWTRQTPPGDIAAALADLLRPATA